MATLAGAGIFAGKASSSSLKLRGREKSHKKKNKRLIVLDRDKYLVEFPDKKKKNCKQALISFSPDLQVVKIVDQINKIKLKCGAEEVDFPSLEGKSFSSKSFVQGFIPHVGSIFRLDLIPYRHNGSNQMSLQGGRIVSAYGVYPTENHVMITIRHAIHVDNI